MKINKVIKKVLFGSNLYNIYLSKNSIRSITFSPRDAWPGDPNLGDKIAQGYYNLAGRKANKPNESLWKINDKRGYWLKETHSFSWLRHLKARSGSIARKHARHLILEWIQNNERWNEKSWEVEILSRRISSWVTNLDFLLAEKDESFSHIFKRNIFKQIKHLNHYVNKKYFYSIEKEFGVEIGSVKKIKILRGLILSSICFEGEEKKYTKCIKILNGELEKIFNEEGVHFSKSPSTQLGILSDLVTIREAIISKHLAVPEYLSIIIQKASHSLRFFRTNNGRFAIFNGSKQETKFLIDKILSLADGKARGRGPLSLSKSGFEKLTSPGIQVFVDTFKYNRGFSTRAPHAMEIIIGKTRLLGSCGTVYQKEKDWKKSLLSSAAHSTLTIENTNPFSTKDTNQKVEAKRFKKNGSELIQLVHYGYKKRYSAICSRTIELGDDGKNLAVLDQIYSEKLLMYAIRLHFNPDTKISLSLDKKKAIILLNEQGWILNFDGTAKLHLEQSIFVEDNGNVLDSNQLVIKGETIKETTEVLWGLNRKS